MASRWVEVVARKRGRGLFGSAVATAVACACLVRTHLLPAAGGYCRRGLPELLGVLKII